MADPPAVGGLREAWLRLSPNHRGAIWMVGAAFGFTFNSALVKALGAADFHPFQLAFLRTAVAFVVLLPVVWQLGPAVLRTRRPGIHVIRGIFGGCAVMAGFYAITLMPLADFMALSFTIPLFMIVLAVIVVGEPVRWRRWSATAVGFIGVLIMIRPGTGTLEPGAILALAMALGISIAAIMVKRFPPDETPVSMLFWFSFGATLLSAVPAALVWRDPTAVEWLWLIAMGCLGAGAQFMIIRAYKIGEATFVAPFDYSKLLIAGLIGYFAFAEVPDLWTLTGAAVIVASTLYIARREAALGQVKAAAKEI